MTDAAFRELLEFAAWASSEAQATSRADFEDLFEASGPWPEDLLDVVLATLPEGDSLSPHSGKFCNAEFTTVPPPPTDDNRAQALKLLCVAQTAQRTDAWYAQSMDLLTASELAQIFKPGRTRGLLVMAKTQPSVSRSTNATAHSENMTAFDWGIRFEPVVKQIYEHKYGSRVADVGRIHHPTLARCAASPDGVVVDGPRAGRLLEIKCPVTRDPGLQVPEEYYAQMQQQLEVCDLDLCDYVEVKIRAAYSSPVPMKVEGPALYFGTVWRTEREVDGLPVSRYIYGPLNVEQLCCEDLGADEIVVERVPWELMTWNEIAVPRNRSWWSVALPKIEAFWTDVEAARRGEFVLPESKVKRAPEKCMVVFKAKPAEGLGGLGDVM